MFEYKGDSSSAAHAVAGDAFAPTEAHDALLLVPQMLAYATNSAQVNKSRAGFCALETEAKADRLCGWPHLALSHAIRLATRTFAVRRRCNNSHHATLLRPDQTPGSDDNSCFFHVCFYNSLRSLQEY